MLANLFLHYAFDTWMTRNHPRIPFERYADDAICHCKSAEDAQALWSALADRFAACKLVLHPEKTKIVYCQDANRRGDFPNQSFAFLGFMFRARKALGRGRRAFACFLPAASPKALKAISRTIRRWTLHHHSDKSLQNLAETYNPYIQGWINYYGHFCRTRLRPTLKRIDVYVIRWARRKYKRLRHQTKGTRDGFDRSVTPTDAWVYLSRAQLFLHRNDRFASAFTWVVPGHFLVSKSRIETYRVNGGIGDNPATARRRNESFGGCDHLAPYSAALETRLYRD